MSLGYHIISYSIFGDVMCVASYDDSNELLMVPCLDDEVVALENDRVRFSKVENGRVLVTWEEFEL